MPEKSPAFQFYPRDYLTDARVIVMGNEARGVYMNLLCVCWLEGQLPADDDALARLGLCAPDVWSCLKPAILACFTLDQTAHVYRHGRLDRERDKQVAYAATQADAGKRGAERRWRPQHESIGSPSVGYGEPIATPMAKHGSASASASASAEYKTPATHVASDAGFDRFWDAYPRKIGKGACRSVWRKLAPSADLQETILQAIARQRACEQWLKDGGQFIPHPVTWLRQGRWDDEPDVPTAAPVPPVDEVAQYEAWRARREAIYGIK